MTAVTVLVVIALMLTIGSLIAGVISMSRGGEFDRRHGTQFMFARVGFQTVTVLVLLVALYFL